MLNDIRLGFNSSLMGRALFFSGIGVKGFFCALDRKKI